MVAACRRAPGRRRMTVSPDGSAVKYGPDQRCRVYSSRSRARARWSACSGSIMRCAAITQHTVTARLMGEPHLADPLARWTRAIRRTRRSPERRASLRCERAETHERPAGERRRAAAVDTVTEVCRALPGRRGERGAGSPRSAINGPGFRVDRIATPEWFRRERCTVRGCARAFSRRGVCRAHDRPFLRGTRVLAARPGHLVTDDANRARIWPSIRPR